MEEIYEKLIQELLNKGFGYVDNWFSTIEIKGLRDELLHRFENNAFKPAAIGNKFNELKEKTIRNDKIYWLDKEQVNPVEKRFFFLIDEFTAYLNRTCFAGVSNYEFHYAVYESGSFYKRHCDQFNNDDSRRFSFVLYLNEERKPEDGGELVIYGNETTTIIPQFGRVVFFSSELEHEVKMNYKERLSLTGWLKTNKAF